MQPDLDGGIGIHAHPPTCTVVIALTLHRRLVTWVLLNGEFPAALPADLRRLPHGTADRADCRPGVRAQLGTNALCRPVVVLAVCESGFVRK